MLMPNRYILQLIVLGVVILGLGRWSIGKEKEIAGWLSVSSPADLNEQIRRTVREASQSSIEQLKIQGNLTIALAAAWEQERRSFCREESQQLVAMGRFLGFVEGRLRTDIPIWWENAVLRAENLGPLFGFDLADAGQSPSRITQVPFHWQQRRLVIRSRGDELPCKPSNTLAPRAANVVNQGGIVVISLGNRSIALSGEAMIKSAPFTGISVLFRDNHVFVALHSQTPSPYALLCFDAKSKALIWRSQVWAAGGFRGYEGFFRHWVGIQDTDNIVRVVGVGCDCAYIEEFAKEDGKARLRFGTVYGGIDDGLKNRERPACR